MKLSLVAVAAATASMAQAELTPAWTKVVQSLNLGELNLNYDRARVESHYGEAVGEGGLSGAERAVGEALLGKLLAANQMHIMALQDLRSWLFYPSDEPAVTYGVAGRGVRAVDFRLPDGFLETQGVFDDRDGSHPVTDIPGCAVCPSTW